MNTLGHNVNRTKYNIKQIVSFFRDDKRLSGRVEEITLFRRTETIGLLVNIGHGKKYWIGEEEVLKQKKGGHMPNIHS